MEFLENLLKRLDAAEEETQNIINELKNKNKIDIITMGESPPLMNPRDFITDSKENAVDMKGITQKDNEGKEFILGTRQRLDRIYRKFEGKL